MPNKKALVVSSFRDAGTGHRYTAGDTPMIDAGAFANYEAAGLVRAPSPDAAPRKAAKSKPAKRRSAAPRATTAATAPASASKPATAVPPAPEVTAPSA